MSACPFAHVFLLGIDKGGIVDVVVVVSQIGFVGGVFLVEAHDAVGIAIFLGLRAHGVRNLSRVHAIESHIKVTFLNLIGGEASATVVGVGDGASLFCVLGGAILSRGILE